MVFGDGDDDGDEVVLKLRGKWDEKKRLLPFSSLSSPPSDLSTT